MQINHLGKDKVIINHVGLGKEDGRADIAGCFQYENIGGTNLRSSKDGAFRLISLDSYMKNNFKEKNIDLIKIDVEGFEYEVLLGAAETLDKYGPIIVIESFENNFKKVNSFLNSHNYKMKEDLGNSNYLYVKETK